VQHIVTERGPIVLHTNDEIEGGTHAPRRTYHEITFGKVYIVKPLHVESDGIVRDILPHEARVRDITYACKVFVDVEHTVYAVESETFDTFHDVLDTLEPLTQKDALSAEDVACAASTLAAAFASGHMPDATSDHALASVCDPPRAGTVTSAALLDFVLACTSARNTYLEGVPQRTTTYREVPLCDIPCMLQSKYCHLRDAPGFVRGECFFDGGGYFIVRGKHKVLQPQNKMRFNVPVVSKASKAKTKYAYECELRSVDFDAKFRSTSTLKTYIRSRKSTPFIETCIPFISRGTLGLVTVYRLLGFSDPATIRALVWAHVPGGYEADDANVRRTFELNFSHPQVAQTMEELYEKFADGSDAPTPAKKQRLVHQQITGEFLPHIGFDTGVKTRVQKAVYFGIIVRRLIRVLLGIGPRDSRDFVGFKHLEIEATTLALLFRQLFGQFRVAFQRAVKKKIQMSGHFDVVALISKSSITADLARAFSTGDMTVRGSSANAGGVIQAIQNVNILAARGHMERTNKQQNRDGKYPEPRKLRFSQFGIFCASETPEGAPCGLVETLANFAKIRLGMETSSVVFAVLALGVVVPLRAVSSVSSVTIAPIVPIVPPRGAFVFVNGTPIGHVTDSDAFLDTARAARRRGILPQEIGIARAEYGILIMSDADVGMFPAFVWRGRATLETLRELDADTRGSGREIWSLALMRGAVEYIEAWEARDCVIASTFDDALAAPDRFTHVLIHPTSVYGTSVSTVPYANHNQAPRNTYQASMVKQTIGAPTTAFADAFHMPYIHVLDSPQRPLADTIISDVKNLQAVPLGQNMVVAIMAFTGATQEDPVILNRAFLDRGGARTTVYKMFKTTVTGGPDAQTLENPLDSVPERGAVVGMREGNYGKLEIDGLPPVGAWVEDGDAIIGKTIARTELSEDTGTQRIVRCDASTFFRSGCGERGIIDAIVLTNNAKGHLLVKVRVRIQRIPQDGDKFSSRHGQKGTVGLIMRQEDLPFVEHGPNAGIAPDLIINPLAVPSRMTIGQLLEAVASRIATETGGFADATPFMDTDERVSGQRARELLRRLHDETREEDKVVMRNGMTGERLEASIFIHPTFYQVLRHMVPDKIHARSRGPRAQLTRQPVEGRKSDGGLRFGEMERDGVVAHGAADFLFDRMVTVADSEMLNICREDGCGEIVEATRYTLENLMLHGGNIPFCRACKKSHAVPIPGTYCWYLLTRELQAMGIKTEHVVADAH